MTTEMILEEKMNFWLKTSKTKYLAFFKKKIKKYELKQIALENTIQNLQREQGSVVGTQASENEVKLKELIGYVFLVLERFNLLMKES